MTLEFNEIYEPLFFTNARYIHIWGGRGRGGSHTATNYFLHLATQPEPFRGFLMREVHKDIRESLWRDLMDRVDDADVTTEFSIKDGEMSAECIENGNSIKSKGFKKSSAKQTAKLKSIAGATHIIVEEAEEISEEDFKQLDDTLRTTKIKNIQVILVFNPPPKDHWIWRRWYNLSESHVPGYFTATPKTDGQLLSIFSTYKNNEQNLSKSFIQNQLKYKETDPEHYYTRVEGLISEGKIGRIYKNWKTINTMPGLYPKFYGLDWGFNDPVALIECEVHNKTLWVRELIYSSDLTNAELSKRMTELGISKSAPIYADSAEPKDIKDLQLMRWNIIAAQKGPDSVLNGIKFVKEFEVFATENSVNLWHENHNYRWRMVNKIPTNEPIDEDNHLMDALRYALDKVKKPKALRII